ncbi:class I SAM-dependent methyltransferase [Candidatus Pacearchaeota archaeon]|nr:class I SAM-dependent methyltransferase [Candidatus Pacearchaeota archaeon]
MIAEQKPRRIIGIDISEKMLEIARAEEEKRKQGIEYYQGDVSETDLTQFGKFDLATGCFLLHYSSSREMLENMLDNINSLLKSRGRFVGININPELTPNWQNYQHRYIFPKREEGARLGIELFSSEGIKFAEFTAFYWGRKTYEEAFKKAGFVCSWIPLEVSQEGKEQCGEHYFDAYLANPSCLILELKKIKIKKLD